MLAVTRRRGQMHLIPGMLILETRRHVASAGDYGSLIVPRAQWRLRALALATQGVATRVTAVLEAFVRRCALVA